MEKYEAIPEEPTYSEESGMEVGGGGKTKSVATQTNGDKDGGGVAGDNAVAGTSGEQNVENQLEVQAQAASSTETPTVPLEEEDGLPTPTSSGSSSPLSESSKGKFELLLSYHSLVKHYDAMNSYRLQTIAQQKAVIDDLQNQLKRFWEMEKDQEKVLVATEEEAEAGVSAPQQSEDDSSGAERGGAVSGQLNSGPLQQDGCFEDKEGGGVDNLGFELGKEGEGDITG